MRNTKFRKNIISGFGVMLFVVMGAISALANHPVLVEGNCLGDGSAQRTIVPPGTCGDYDGDGRIGTAEDNDMPFNRVFGTINAANSATGINNNGTITIVASGTFPEIVTLTGNVTLQAAPGVIANLDAVVQATRETQRVKIRPVLSSTHLPIVMSQFATSKVANGRAEYKLTATRVSPSKAASSSIILIMESRSMTTRTSRLIRAK